MNDLDLAPTERLLTRRVTDQRDWKNQLHGGERVVMQTRLSLPGRSEIENQ